MRGESRCARCLYYCRAGATFLFSHIGLCGLVVGYAIMGAFTFEALEATNERFKRTEMMAARDRVVEDLWGITYQSSVLQERNWTEDVTLTLRDFEIKLVQAVRKEGYDGNDELQLQWSFSGALLYSIIVITTIGYGNIAPKTAWGKVVTILYAIVGIPLMLLCLSNIGDAMAHSFKFIYWKVCCYLCVKPHKHRRRKRRYPASRLDDYDKTLTDGSSGGYVSSEPVTPSYPGTPHFQLATPFPRTQAQADANRVPIISNRYVIQPGDDMPSVPYGRPPPPPPPPHSNLPPPTPSPTSKSHCTWNLDTVERDDSEDDTETEEDEDDISEEVSVPIWLCLAIVVSYICGGAVLFTFWEDWDFLDSSYFCFVTLTTIGFGDLVPGTAVLSEDAQLTLGLCALYLLFGMALLAMSFNLVQEEVTKSVKCVGKRLGILADEDDDI